MPAAQELAQVSPGIFIWQVYDPTVKADLFSTALETPSGTYLLDPVALDADCLTFLASRQKAAGIVVTNENHARATADLAGKLSVPVYLHETLLGTIDFPRKEALKDKALLAPGLTVIAIEGAPPGEIAIHDNTAGGSIVVGDALINFEPHGFGLLPAKYCSDFKLMRRSLGTLLEFSFERMLFAHGTPILSGARGRLEQLLAGNC